MNSLEVVETGRKGIVVSYAEMPTEAKNIQILWVEAAIAAAQAAFEMSEKMKFQKWQSDVSDKLSDIFNLLEQIQAELRQLKVWIDERISEETRRQYSFRIRSLGTDINNIISAIGHNHNKATPSQIADLHQHFRELRLTLSDLMQTDGYSHVMSVVTGAISCLPLFSLLKRKSERAAWAASISKYFEQALSISDQKSIEYARNHHANEFVRLKAVFTGRLNQWWRTNSGREADRHIPSRIPGEGHDHYPATLVYWKQIANGALESGAQLAGREYGQGSAGAPGWYPELPEQYDMGDGPDKGWFYMHQNLEGYRLSALREAGEEAKVRAQIASILEIKKTVDQAAKPIKSAIDTEAGDFEFEVIRELPVAAQTTEEARERRASPSR